MSSAVLDLMRASANSMATDETAAESLLEVVGAIEDERAPQVSTMRTLARMHRAKAIANRARLGALAVEYVRRTRGGLG